MGPYKIFRAPIATTLTAAFSTILASFHLREKSIA